MTLAGKAAVIVFILTILFATSPEPATADLFYVIATFTDGGTMSGTFQLDRSHRTIDFFSIGTTTGSVLNGFNYESSGTFIASVSEGVGSAPVCETQVPILSFFFQVVDPLAHELVFSVPATSVATFLGGDITTACFAYERFGPGQVTRSIAKGQVFTIVGAEASLGLGASVNQSTFTVGQTLRTSASVNDPGLQGSADFYLGVLLPDRVTIVFWTGGSSTAVGRLHDVQTYRPYATGVSLATPFFTNLPNFFSHEWTGNEPRGTYVLLNVATKTGALADGAIASDDVLGLATATFAFP